MIKITKNRLKINIIPLIDIIFLMLVFFMLATNFSEKKEVVFSVSKENSENASDKNNLFVYLQNNKFLINKKSIEDSKIETEIINFWKTKTYENIVILNDDKSSLQRLIFLMDILKKNNIKKVSFADDPDL